MGVIIARYYHVFFVGHFQYLLLHLGHIFGSPSVLGIHS